MKRWYILMLVLLAGCFVAVAEVTDDELEDLEDKVKISSINDDDFEEDDIDYQELKIRTYQDEDSAEEYTFYISVTVEFTEKKTKKSSYAQFARTQDAVDSEYNGEDSWQFIMAEGDLEKPKISAYVIQYGIIVDKKFIVVVEEMDDVDSLEELMTRTPDKVPQKPRILHQHNFRDSENEIQTSMWK